MPVDDLGDYEVEGVDHNPFGSMASSPNDYDVQAVDHDPFAEGDYSLTVNRQPARTGIGSDANVPITGQQLMAPEDRDALVKTVYGEARGEPELGQAAVTHAILNRLHAGGYGDTISDIVKAPAAGVNPKLGYHEFSPWNTGSASEGQPAAQRLDPNSDAYARIGNVVDKAYYGLIPDPTGGATHYYGRMIGEPKWAPPLEALNKRKIGNQTFVGLAEGPGRRLPRLASDYQSGGPVELNAELRRRLALITAPRHRFADGGDVDGDNEVNVAGHAALDKMMSDDRAAHPDAPPEPAPPEPQVYGGAWGQAAERGYQDVMGALGTAQNWLGDQLEHHVGTVAAAVGVPNATGFARDIRGIVETGEGLAPMRHAEPAFPEGRIATRVPSAVGPIADAAHLSNDAKIGLDTIQSQPAMYAKTAQVAREMPYVKGDPVPVMDRKTGQPKIDPKTGQPVMKPSWVPTGQHNFPADWTDDQVHEALVEFHKSNILALHDAVPEDIRPSSSLWYDGANNRATQKAVIYGRPVENTAGVYASLSPQKDWFENVSLGDRVMDIMHNQQDTPFSPEMWKWARTFAAGDPERLAIYKSMRPTKDYPGRTLGSINDPETQALWLRAYDEAHHPRDYNIVNPDGTFGPKQTNTDGSNSRVAWGGFDAIEKAITAFNAPDMGTISRAMGERHKVRNFYNNIVAPNSEHGDVTVDTHAIAGSNLRPMAGEDKDVDIGLGGSGGSSRVTGANGLYGVYAEAYRRAAAERGILPRQMQSITWEALRGLWSPAQKADPRLNAFVQDVWSRYQRGEIDQATAQRMLMTDPQTGASRIQPPDWHRAGWRPKGALPSYQAGP